MFDKILSVIVRCIVDIDYMIVGIILHKNRVEVPQVESSLYIIVWGYNYAKGQLLFAEFIDFVCFIKLFLLLGDKRLDSADFLHLAGVEFRHVDTNFTSIFHAICDLKLSDSLKELLFGDTFFGFSFSEHFLDVSFVDNLVDWDVESIGGLMMVILFGD